MKIYTKGGDKGRTSLVDGTRISKADKRVEVYGTLDELTAAIGVLHDQYLAGTKYSSDIISACAVVMDAAAAVAGVDGKISDEKIEKVENKIDELSENLPVLHNFTLPVGCAPMSAANLCRTICRRAERLVVALIEDNLEDKNLVSVQIYLNRLSDLLYVLGRILQKEKGDIEILWHSGLEMPKK